MDLMSSGVTRGEVFVDLMSSGVTRGEVFVDLMSPPGEVLSGAHVSWCHSTVARGEVTSVEVGGF